MRVRIKRCLEFAEGVGSSWSTGNVIALLRTPRPPFDVELEVLALITVEWMNDCSLIDKVHVFLEGHKIEN